MPWQAQICFYSFLTSTQHRVHDQRHAPAPAPLFPGKRPGTHCRRGWVGPRAGLDECAEKTATCPLRDSSPQPSSPLRVAISASVALNSGGFEGQNSTALPSCSKAQEIYNDNFAQQTAL